MNLSRRREVKYVILATLPTFSGGIAAVDFHDWRQVAAFVSALLFTGWTASRAYHDKSSSNTERQP